GDHGDVEPERPVEQVLVVHLDHSPERDAPGSRQLPWAGEARPRLLAQSRTLDQRVLLRRQGPGPDQAHRAGEDLKQLWELVERSRSQPAPEAGEARIVLNLEEPLRRLAQVAKAVALELSAGHHRPELEHAEGLAVPTDSPGAEKDRAGRVEFDEDRQQR